MHRLKQVFSKDIQTLFPSFWKYRFPVFLTITFSLGAAVFEGFSIGMLIPFLQTLSDDGNTFRTGVQWVDTHLLGSEASTISRMYRICGLILLSTVLRSTLSYFAGVYAIISRSRIVQDLRQRIGSQLTSVALAFYATTRSGEIVNSVTNEVSRTAGALTALFGFVTQGSLMLMYVSLMIWISWELSLLALTAFLLLSLALKIVIGRVRSGGQAITSANASFTDRMAEFLAGVRTVMAYNMQDTEEKRLHEAAARSSDAVIQTNRQSKLIQPISQAVISSILILLVVYAVQHFVLTGAMSMAFLLTFLFALFRMMPNIHAINNQRGVWAENGAALSNVADLLRSSDKPYLDEGTRPAHPLKEAIVFDRVSFAYQPPNTILKDVNLRIEQGKTTALIGASGAGKSTLADLIPRFYDPIEGRILYDGTDLRDFDLHSLRDRIAIVSQSAHIFNDTVRANIAYGAQDVTENQICQAAQQANALSFIEDMEDGLDTILGEDGTRVSGGQRQRIAIARAILQDPDILILDEATSDLDSISEKLVQSSLEKLMQGRTVIAIAHRLSTIQNADWVVVLENGEIAEQGPYHVLLEQEGLLWEYHRVQYQLA